MAVSFNVLNFVFQTDDIGDVYQDEENMAALLVQRDAKNGGILVVSSALSAALLRTFSPSEIERKKYFALLPILNVIHNVKI